MSTSSLAYPASIQRAGRPPLVVDARPVRRRAPTRPGAAEVKQVIERIRSLMRQHCITPDEIGAVDAVSRIRTLMQLHKITLDELRQLLAQQPSQAQPQMDRQAPITRCPSIGYDPRYQLPPGATVVGPFTTEWHQLRGEGQ